jgi:hypothetical protein
MATINNPTQPITSNNITPNISTPTDTKFNNIFFSNIILLIILVILYIIFLYNIHTFLEQYLYFLEYILFISFFIDFNTINNKKIYSNTIYIILKILYYSFLLYKFHLFRIRTNI